MQRVGRAPLALCRYAASRVAICGGYLLSIRQDTAPLSTRPQLPCFVAIPILHTEFVALPWPTFIRPSPMPDSLPTTSVTHAQRPLFLGVDVGGTNTKIGIVDDRGGCLGRTKIATEEENGAEDAVRRISAACQQLAEKLGLSFNDVQAVGLATPGTMDVAAGMILEPPNMPAWRHFPIRDALSQSVERPVHFLNDGNAAAFGEFWVGAAQEWDSLVMLTLGTGVGGGVIVAGRLIHGLNSFGSECGHIIVDSSPQARPCVWGGGHGELEAYASASAVVQLAQQRLDQKVESTLAARRDQNDLTALAVYQEARAGDALALELIDDTARILGIAIVTMVHMVDPGLVLLGGAMSFGGPNCPIGQRFLAHITEEFKRRAFDVVRDRTSIQFASLGGHAGFVGAAGYARQQQQEAPR